MAPIVVFDGSQEAAKLETLKQRFTQKTEFLGKLGKSLFQNDEDANSGLPFWCSRVMKEALTDCGVPCISADGEADPVTAALARVLNCPVLTGDSDFFIFDIPEGVVHVEELNWKQPWAPLWRFRRSLFLQFVGTALKRDKHSRPVTVDDGLFRLAASLAGNDFVMGEHLPTHLYGGHI